MAWDDLSRDHDPPVHADHALPAGGGPCTTKALLPPVDEAQLEQLAGPTVELIGMVSTTELAELVGQSRAFMFPGVEDFGILPVEVQAGGCPVIALGKGGALETVRHGETGLLYENDSAEGLLDAVRRFESETFSPEACRENALRFNRNRFEEEIALTVRGIFEDI